jgi:hypothetical protein
MFDLPWCTRNLLVPVPVCKDMEHNILAVVIRDSAGETHQLLAAFLNSHPAFTTSPGEENRIASIGARAGPVGIWLGAAWPTAPFCSYVSSSDQGSEHL